MAVDRVQFAGGRFGDGRDNPFLVRLRLLPGLEDAELAALGRLLGEPHPVRARTEIVRDGDRADHLHVVLEGWAGRVHLLPDGRRQLTRLLLPGDVGDLDTLYLGRGGASISSLTSCVVATVRRTALRELASRQEAVADALGRLAAVENRMLAERNACLGRRSAREHLTHLFCELAVRLSPVGLGSERGFALPITQEEIADVLGLTAVHVNRVLQSLRTEGLIEQSGHMVRIRDWTALKRQAGFRAGYLQVGDGDGDGSDGRAPVWLATSPQPPGS